MNAHVTLPSGTKSLAKPAILQADPDVSSQANLGPRPTAPASVAPAQPESGMGATPAVNEPERRRAMIAEAAYYRAAGRGFEPGRELEDWTFAEGEVDAMLARGEVPAVCGTEDVA